MRFTRATVLTIGGALTAASITGVTQAAPHAAAAAKTAIASTPQAPDPLARVQRPISLARKPSPRIPRRGPVPKDLAHLPTPATAAEYQATRDDALLAAHARNHRVEIGNMSTASRTFIANPNGTISELVYGGPVFTGRGLHRRFTGAGTHATVGPSVHALRPTSVSDQRSHAMVSTSTNDDSTPDSTQPGVVNASTVAAWSEPGGLVTLDAPTLNLSSPSTDDGGSVTYSDAAPATDLAVMPSSQGFEWHLTMKSAAAPSSFTFTLNDPGNVLGGLGAPISGGGQAFADGYILNPVLMYESKPDSDVPDPGVIPASNAAKMTVSTVGGGYRVTVTPDPSWLAAASYPVVLDPFLEDKGSAADSDCFIASPSPYSTTSYCGSTYGYLGSLQPWTGRYLFDPYEVGIGTGWHIVGAKLAIYMNAYSGGATRQAQICQATYFRGIQSVTWGSTQGGAPTNCAVGVTLQGHGWYYPAFTSEYQNEVTNASQQKGFVLMYSNESDTAKMDQYYTSLSSTNTPYVDITYVAPPPAPPMSASSGPNGTVTVHWTAPYLDQGSITGYGMFLYECANDHAVGAYYYNYSIGMPPTDGQGYYKTVSGLDASKCYYWRGQAFDESGGGALSLAANSYGYPAAPTITTTVGDSSITVAASPGQGGGGGAVARYLAYVYPLTSPATVWPSGNCIAASPLFASTFTFNTATLASQTGCGGRAATAPANKSSYTVEVCADTDQSGEGASACTPAAGWGPATLTTAVLPSAPEVTITRDNGGTLTASWSPTTGAPPPASYNATLQSCFPSTPIPAHNGLTVDSATGLVSTTWSGLDPNACYGVLAWGNYSWGAGPASSTVAPTYSYEPTATVDNTGGTLTGSVSYPNWVLDTGAASDGGDGTTNAVTMYELQLYLAGQSWPTGTMLSCQRIAADAINDVSFTFDAGHGTTSCGGGGSPFVPLAGVNYAVEVFPMSATGVSFVDSASGQAAPAGYGVPAIGNSGGLCAPTYAQACTDGVPDTTPAAAMTLTQTYQQAAQALSGPLATYKTDLQNYVTTQSDGQSYQGALATVQTAQGQLSSEASTLGQVISNLQSYVTGGAQSNLLAAQQSLLPSWVSANDVVGTTTQIVSEAPPSLASEAQGLATAAAAVPTSADAAEDAVAGELPPLNDTGGLLCSDSGDLNCGFTPADRNDDATLSSGDGTNGGIFDVDPTTGWSLGPDASSDPNVFFSPDNLDTANVCHNKNKCPVASDYSPVRRGATQLNIQTGSLVYKHHGTTKTVGQISADVVMQQSNPLINNGQIYFPCKHTPHTDTSTSPPTVDPGDPARFACRSYGSYYHTESWVGGGHAGGDPTQDSASPLRVNNSDPTNQSSGPTTINDDFAELAEAMGIEIYPKVPQRDAQGNLVLDPSTNNPIPTNVTDGDCVRIRFDVPVDSNTASPNDLDFPKSTGILTSKNVGNITADCVGSSDVAKISGTFKNAKGYVDYQNAGPNAGKFNISYFQKNYPHKLANHFSVASFGGGRGSPNNAHQWSTGAIWGGPKGTKAHPLPGATYKLTVKFNSVCYVFRELVHTGQSLQVNFRVDLPYFGRPKSEVWQLPANNAPPPKNGTCGPKTT